MAASAARCTVLHHSDIVKQIRTSKTRLSVRSDKSSSFSPLANILSMFSVMMPLTSSTCMQSKGQYRSKVRASSTVER